MINEQWTVGAVTYFRTELPLADAKYNGGKTWRSGWITLTPDGQDVIRITYWDIEPTTTDVEATFDWG